MKHAKLTPESNPAASSITEADAPPFSISCPEPEEEADDATDIYRCHGGPLENSLQICYSVHPGKSWSKLHNYKNMHLFRLDNESGEKGPPIRVGDYVLINPDPSPQAVRNRGIMSMTEIEFLEHHKRKSWVGRLGGIRATDSAHVYPLIWWLWWPDELPGGRKPYHGRYELVLGNYPEIIDAHTIIDRVDVTHWDESNDDEKPIEGFFWRQTYDLSQAFPPRTNGVLSSLRKHCVCRKEYNPNTTMYFCSSCSLWNHSSCLRQSLERELDTLLRKGVTNLRDFLDRKAKTLPDRKGDTRKREARSETSSLVSRFKDTIFQKVMVDGGIAQTRDSSEEIAFDAAEALSPRKTGRKRKHAQLTAEATEESTPSKRPGRVLTAGTDDTEKVKVLSVETHDANDAGNNDSNSAVVAQVRLTSGQANVAHWTIPLDCCSCGKRLT